MAPNEDWAQELLRAGRELYADEEVRTRDLWQRADMLLRSFALLAAGIVWLVAQTIENMVAESFSIESFVPVLFAVIGAGFLGLVAWHLAPVLAKTLDRVTPSDPTAMLQHFEKTRTYFSKRHDKAMSAGEEEGAHRSAIDACREFCGRQYFEAAQKNRGMNDWQAKHLLSGRFFLVCAAFLAAMAFMVDQLRAVVSESKPEELGEHDDR